ncbi:SH3 domain-containing protein [Leptospira sp. GIMC2001]|uniref:SH3 domain-containing protein n=1 Tax=Leptospira sp. GIMC2001 TaxID=1513297 RepID=UPI00234AE536|nr:SH3 domain-containing protein [Leptospira sp. GIMC2001]WCL49560.1 SH3 domain-containing protein [Leptospira sp. GIMC2001]
MKTILKPLIILSFFGILLSSNCKSKAISAITDMSLYQGYVISPNGVAILESPGDYKKKLTVLKKGTEFKVLQDKIPDPKVGDKKFWYKVSGSDKEGFISYDEAILNQSISVFHKTEKETGGIITASNLNVRDFPGTDSKVSFQVNQFDLVKILATGSFYETIRGKSGYWQHIETEDGKQGYAFGSHITIYPMAEAKAAQARKEIEISGLVRITTDKPKFLDSPGPTGKPVSPEKIFDLIYCYSYDKSLEPKKGEFIQVSRKAQIDSKNYYFAVYQHFSGMEGCEIGAGGWIEDSSIEYYTNFDYSELTKKEATHLSSEQISALTNYHSKTNPSDVGSSLLNLKLSYIEPISWNETSGSLPLSMAYIFYGYKHDRMIDRSATGSLVNSPSFNSYDFTKVIFLKTEKGLTEISNEIWGEPTFADLDNDGKPEILLTQEERGGISYSLMGWVNGRYEPINLEFDGSSEIYDMEIRVNDDNTITTTVSKYNEATKDWDPVEKKYKYSKGKMIAL